MKKLLILSNSSSGLYEFRNELLIDMMKDHEVHISLPDHDHYYDMIAAEGCHMIHTPFERRGMNPVKDIGLLRTYIKIIRELRPDIVFTYTIKPNIYGGMACRLTKTSYITNITGLGTAIQGGGKLAKILTFMYKVAINKAKCVFFQNEYNKSFLQENGVAVNNARLLPGSGVNIEQHAYKPYPSEKKAIYILSVMRVMRDKGIEEYLDAVESFGGRLRSDIIGVKDVEYNPLIHFVLAGNYEEETREKYEPTIRRLVDKGKLTFLGFVDDMDSQYEKCHMVLHPSYHEGLSNVCLEAASNGRMVVASDIPGCRETVNDNSGLLFETRNSEALYASLFDAISLSCEERKNMGIAGREHVSERFDRKVVINRYREVLKE